ncbi:FkbM family methyltransferase [Sphingopyxis panaciterrae]
MATANYYDIWRLLSHPRTENEADIRALCRSSYLGDHVSLCRVLGRYKMFVDTQDIGIASHLMMDGFWEMWVTEAMLRAVRRGSVVIDVGANLGYFTLLLADLTGPEGRVLSFEPNPKLAGLLDKSLQVNGFTGFTDLHRIALGAGESALRLEVQDSSPGGGRVLLPGAERSPNTTTEVEVPVRRLDTIGHALAAEFIKIDVEGFEQQVWHGMTGILKQKKPLTIFMEFTVQRYADAEGFLAEVLAYGFSLGIVHPFEGVRPIEKDELFAMPHNIDHMLVFRR